MGGRACGAGRDGGIKWGETEDRATTIDQIDLAAAGASTNGGNKSHALSNKETVLYILLSKLNNSFALDAMDRTCFDTQSLPGQLRKKCLSLI